MKQNDKLLIGYELGFKDGVLNSLSGCINYGIVRDNRSHKKKCINYGNYLKDQIEAFLKIENNQKIILNRINNKSKEREKMKVQVQDKSKKEDIKVNVKGKK